VHQNCVCVLTTSVVIPEIPCEFAIAQHSVIVSSVIKNSSCDDYLCCPRHSGCPLGCTSSAIAIQSNRSSTRSPNSAADDSLGWRRGHPPELPSACPSLAWHHRQLVRDVCVATCLEVRRCLLSPQIIVCASSGLILFSACQRRLLQDKRCFTVHTSHPLRHLLTGHWPS
jgi:hypothetical protein